MLGASIVTSVSFHDAAFGGTDEVDDVIALFAFDHFLLDHFEHIIRVAGIDHVGLGSDFDGVGGLLPAGMDDVTRLPLIAQGLMDRGYSDDDVRKVLGGNMLRVMERAIDRK